MLEQPNDHSYVFRKVMEDFSEKLNEVIEHINKLEGGLPTELVQQARMLDDLKVDLSKKTPAEVEVLERFVNSGESCLRISAANILMPVPDITGFDVVLVKKLDAETDQFAKVADTAIFIAKKRAILGIHTSLIDDWHFYMARVPFHWEAYEFEFKGNEMEYYIIDKLEGQESLV